MLPLYQLLLMCYHRDPPAGINNEGSWVAEHLEWMAEPVRQAMPAAPPAHTPPIHTTIFDCDCVGGGKIWGLG